jgi:hypothetical protein
MRLAMDNLPKALQLSPGSKQAFAALYVPPGIELQAQQVQQTWPTTELAGQNGMESDDLWQTGEASQNCGSRRTSAQHRSESQTDHRLGPEREWTEFSAALVRSAGIVLELKKNPADNQSARSLKYYNEQGYL